MIEQKVKEILKDKFGVEEIDYDDFLNRDLNDDLGLDSMDRVELFYYSERMCNIKPINDYEAEDITTPAKLIKFIEDRVIH